MNIFYQSDRKITAAQFIEILSKSTLDEHGPINNPERIQKMPDHGNILITVRHSDKLINVSRALTDYSFCCYLSDLAVDFEYQKKGIGKKLIDAACFSK